MDSRTAGWDRTELVLRIFRTSPPTVWIVIMCTFTLWRHLVRQLGNPYLATCQTFVAFFSVLLIVCLVARQLQIPLWLPQGRLSCPLRRRTGTII